ncbi:MAG: PLP-dependent aminotransferase family protein [Clostridium sp.]|nr:PLP-dependent aminotransferase family protein [Clostridium sp.]
MKKYEQLYDDIKKKIENGELSAGEKLPSVRKASQLYSVSITTVQNAYFDLCADGYIIAIDKSGYFVTDIKSNEIKIENTPQTRNYKYDFTGGIADEDCFDLALWQRYIKSALRQKERLLSYSEPQGEYDLRQAIAKYVYEKRNIITSPEKIVIGAGVQPLLQILCALLDKNKCVSFPDKSFEQGIGTFSNYGFQVHTRDKDADIIYVSPSHMTRWGDVMPLKRRFELINYSQNRGSIVIEDDYENEFQYNSKPTPSLYTLGKGNIVYMGSFSAMLLPAIRISFMILTDDLFAEYKKNIKRFAQTASLTEQIALCSYIRDGHIYSQTRKIRRLYTAKTKYFYSLLTSNSFKETAVISENKLQVIIKLKKDIKQEVFEKSSINLYMPDERTLVISPMGVPQREFSNAVKQIRRLIEE